MAGKNQTAAARRSETFCPPSPSACAFSDRAEGQFNKGMRRNTSNGLKEPFLKFW